MKTKSILAALLLMASGVQTTWAQLVVLHKTNLLMALEARTLVLEKGKQSNGQ